ncbi:MAG TPA: glutamine-hydrolyzing carbamoyl-phosphate synthase small subunit [Candidatus Methylomirabilis sp.]|nr:glutamine-hydrolyzing carbamoyl-phosphate synthase small subunit [Candidatus Methylomirabilis sp.]
MKKAVLALADGTVFQGTGYGAEGETVGEVVFNTCMSGYQEILTDPSYKGQIVTMTYPLIGNYGVNPEDVESRRPFVEGFVIKEGSPLPSNWRGRRALEDYLREYGIVGIQGVDTRALTRHIRDHGAQEGVISTMDLDPESLVKRAKASPGLIGRDLVKEVCCEAPFTWAQGTWGWPDGYGEPRATSHEPRADKREGQLSLFGSGLGARDSRLATRHSRLYRVVAYDCGIKWNILRQLVSTGCEVTVLPAAATAEQTLALDPDGIFLSNGPGDPEGVPYLIQAVRSLIGKKPIFGICLGHQIIGLALGGRTYKLKFGHHGGNQPVKDLTTDKVEITSQNHGFAVDMASFKADPKWEVLGDPDDIVLTHVNLNDNTCEGLMHRKLPLFSVQYHPEASPGPHDASYLFRRFVTMMEQGAAVPA